MKLLVQQMCTRKGISRMELARRLGVSYNSLASACRNPQLSTIRRLAEALECSPSDLLGEPPSVAVTAGEVVCPCCGRRIAIRATEADCQ